MSMEYLKKVVGVLKSIEGLAEDIYEEIKFEDYPDIDKYNDTEDVNFFK